ncbi:WSC domain-containing protein 1-like [Pollicipes pollicipes]|uniref:WSC domain-containing protein 1-like n=1 Tax=Pollicipes pollicipes TaxID=41117 RepID=UPI00188594CF|nr:WSC domain-containing protein 1-like [Pollicipes pollicipes]
MEAVRLASFPRSGNTWTRYLLESATGLFTSAGGPTYFQYRNAAVSRNASMKGNTVESNRGTELSRMGFAGDLSSWTRGNTIVYKTHSLPEPWVVAGNERLPSDTAPFAPNSTRRAILLIRDPFKACISLMYFSSSQSVLHTDGARAELFQGPEWEQSVSFYARRWFAVNLQWLEATNATHVVMYEHLVRDPMYELRRMLRFLEVEPDPARMECVRLHLEGRAHNKKHSVVPDNTTYPLPLRGLVWSQIHALNLHLKDRGYRELPLEQYSFAGQFRDIGA